jgi:hypothetical protein
MLSNGSAACSQNNLVLEHHTQVIRRNDYAILELRREDGGTGDDGTLGVLVRTGSLEV